MGTDRRVQARHPPLLGIFDKKRKNLKTNITVKQNF
jgi:hypothetical protein